LTFIVLADFYPKSIWSNMMVADNVYVPNLETWNKKYCELKHLSSNK